MSRLVLCLTLLASGDATAQAALFAPMMSSVGHKFLTDRVGWLLFMEVPLLERQVYFRLQVETSDGAGGHFGKVCEAPTAPECQEESIDDRSGFRSTSLAVPIQLLGGSRVALSLIPQLIGGRVWVRMKGRSTGEVLNSNRNFRGPGFGAELSMRTTMASRFSLTVGARYASLFPKRTQRPDVVHPLSREFSDYTGYAGLRFGR